MEWYSIVLTVVISILIFGYTSHIIHKMIKNVLKGKSVDGCSGDCSCCSCGCHSSTKKKAVK